MKLRSIEPIGKNVSARLEDGKLLGLSTKAKWQLGRFIYGNRKWNDLAKQHPIRDLLLASYVQEYIGNLDLDITFRNCRISTITKRSPVTREAIHQALTELGASDIMWDNYICTFAKGEHEFVLSTGDKYGVSAIYLGPKVGEFEWPRHYLEEYSAKPLAIKVGTRRMKHLKERLQQAIDIVEKNWPTAILQAAQEKSVSSIMLEKIMEGPFGSYRMPLPLRRQIVTACARDNVTTLYDVAKTAIVLIEQHNHPNWRMFVQVTSCLLTIEDLNVALARSKS